MRVLVVEDEPALARQIMSALTDAGFTVDLAANGEDGRHIGATENYGAIVLDLGLPLLDGVTVLNDWRANGVTVPVLILTARGSWQERVDGLNAGGDDYLAKPFHMEELIARVRALIRRSSGVGKSVLRAGKIELNTVAGMVTRAGAAVKLTANEYKVLAVLMMRPSQVHNKAALAETVYGLFEERDSNTIEVFIARLRRKLGANSIKTVRGLGYRIGGK